MIVDTNILLYAVDSASPHNECASTWLVDALNGDERIGFPWQSLIGFLRISTHPRIWENPLSSEEAHSYVDAWLATAPAWIPAPDGHTFNIYRRLTKKHSVTANIVPDAQLAATAIWLGVPIVSADTDFARFPEVRWINPLA